MVAVHDQLLCAFDDRAQPIDPTKVHGLLRYRA